MSLLGAALQLIVAHRSRLLTVLLPLYLVGASTVAVVGAVIDRSIGLTGVEGLTKSGAVAFFLVVGILNVAAMIGQVILAVLWHRMVLAPDRIVPGVRPIVRYIWAAIKLVIMLFLLLYLPAMLMGALGLTRALASGTGVGVVQAAMIGVYVLGSWLWLRAGLILPDAALGRSDLGVGESWALTSGRRGGVLGVAVVQLVLVFASVWLSESFAAAWPWVESAVELVVWSLGPLLGLAALTVMYRDAAAEGGVRD